MDNSNTASKAVKAVHYVKSTAALLANLAAQNYIGAAWAGLKLIPVIIAILFLLIIVPIIFLLSLPAMLLDFLNPFSGGDEISVEHIQDSVISLYSDYDSLIDYYIQSIEDKFSDGELDPDVTYDEYGHNLTFDITRETVRSGTRVDAMWFITLLSVYSDNDSDNITPESTTDFISSVLSYDVSEEITRVTRRPDASVHLEINRTLNLDFKGEIEIMDALEFTEEQRMWAEFMYSVISGEFWHDSNDSSAIELRNTPKSNERRHLSWSII
jgi:hypothetical protein